MRERQKEETAGNKGKGKRKGKIKKKNDENKSTVKNL